MTKKQIPLFILLVLLFVLCLGAGVYFLLNPKGSSTTSYKVDRYQELVNWCDTSTIENELFLDCKALLLEIKVIDTNNSCVEAQIITKNKELKDISICGDGSVISFTNDVLDYKKLMPIDVILSYSREDSLSTFELKNVSTTKIEEAYIQNVVNEDIASLVRIDPSTTTIQNSVDFCPNPEMIPNYISSENMNKYTEFYNKNILTKEEYTSLYAQEFANSFLDNWSNPVIKILFGCESSSRMGYNSICNTSIENEFKNTNLSIPVAFVPSWNEKANGEKDLISINNLSLMLDGALYAKEHDNYSLPQTLEIIFQHVYDAKNNQNVYCSEYKIYEKLAELDGKYLNQLDEIKTVVIGNISNASPVCLDILDKNLYSEEGIYLKALSIQEQSILTIYERCNNLYNLMSNE